MTVRTTRLCGLDGPELKDATFVARSFPPHFHDAWSVGLVDEGMERLVLGDEGTLIAHTGLVVVLPPGLVHAHGAFDDAPWRYRVLYLSPDLVAHRRRQCGRALAGRHSDVGQCLDDPALVRDLRALDEQPRRDARVIAIADRLARAMAPESHRPVVNAAARSVVAAMEDAAALIRARFADKLRTDLLAARFGLGPYQLVRAFRRRHGLTPTAYQMVHRINEARRRLQAGARVVDAALDTGFYDQSHFVRYFTRYTGTSPLRYRQGCLRR
jgi:AraC-like DNA-binding protein